MSTFAQQQNQKPSLSNPYAWGGWTSVRNGLPAITTTNGEQVDETQCFFFQSPVSYDKQGDIIRPYVYKHGPLSVFVIENGKVTNINAMLISGPVDDLSWEAKFINPFAIEILSPSGTRSYFFNEPVAARVHRTVYMQNGTVTGSEYRLIL